MQRNHLPAISINIIICGTSMERISLNYTYYIEQYPCIHEKKAFKKSRHTFMRQK